MERGAIHQSTGMSPKGDPVRSKSSVVVAVEAGEVAVALMAAPQFRFTVIQVEIEMSWIVECIGLNIDTAASNEQYKNKCCCGAMVSEQDSHNIFKLQLIGS